MMKDLEAGIADTSAVARKTRRSTASSAKSTRTNILESELMAMVGKDGEDFHGYVMERKVGSGGQGNCWLVTQKTTGRKYILKVSSVCLC
jgi:hypothetical protein